MYFAVNLYLAVIDPNIKIEIEPEMNLNLDLIEYSDSSSSQLARDCEEAGWTVSEYSSIVEYLDSSDNEACPLLILSLPALPDLLIDTESRSPIAGLKEWRDAHPDIQLIMLYPADLVGAEKHALTLGARHSLTLPYDSSDLINILSRIAQGLGKRHIMREVSKRMSKHEGFEKIIGTSKKITAVIDLARKVAKSNFTSVMITGENGTGKGALANAIHQASTRSDGPFIEVNCAAIPKNLLESEFFGYEKGAFTDARERKLGLFELANGGTIFLDEVGEIDYNLQAKLLKFLDSRTIRRVSGTQFLPVDVRIISATNRDLKTAIENNRFRVDLFYRLNVIEVNIPPLRERIEDIKPIAENYISRFAAKMKKTGLKLTDEAMDLLESYSWPGNIRELINLLERAVLLNTSGEINRTDLPIILDHDDTLVHIRKENGTIRVDLPPQGASLDEVEKGTIINALERTRGNITQAAALLGVERGTLRYKLKKHGIDISRVKEKIKNGEYEPVSVTD